jgi:TolB-like protein
MRPAPVTPADQAALDAEVRRFADDPEVLTRIGVQFYEARNYRRARDVLTAALGLRPSFSTAVYLGLAFEGLQQFDEAETAYRTAQTFPLSRDRRDELARRLAALGRARLAAEARRAVAREAELSALPPAPNSVAVLPWSYVGTDRRLQALGVGVPHLMMTDLGKIASLTLIERERVQALLDELALSCSGKVDSATAVRSGRLLRASWVVAGLVRESEDGVQLEARVYRTTDAAEQASSGARDRVERLFALQKQLTLDLVDQLAVPVSPAERRAVSERPTSDLQAFLALSEGLAAQDRGDYRTAAGLFALAAGRDPALGMARQLGELSRLLASAEGSTAEALARVAAPGSLADAGRSSTLLSSVQVVAPSTGGELDLRTRSPIRRPQLPEALRQDNPARIAILGEIIIVIPRP